VRRRHFSRDADCVVRLSHPVVIQRGCPPVATTQDGIGFGCYAWIHRSLASRATYQWVRSNGCTGHSDNVKADWTCVERWRWGQGAHLGPRSSNGSVDSGVTRMHRFMATPRRCGGTLARRSALNRRPVCPHATRRPIAPPQRRSRRQQSVHPGVTPFKLCQVLSLKQ